MKAIINTCQLEKWPIEISAVISDCDCQAIQLARSFNIKTLIFDRKGFKNTHDFEFNLINEINQMKPSLIALAGFMRILSKNFCKIFSDLNSSLL